MKVGNFQPIILGILTLIFTRYAHHLYTLIYRGEFYAFIVPSSFAND